MGSECMLIRWECECTGEISAWLPGNKSLAGLFEMYCVPIFRGPGTRPVTVGNGALSWLILTNVCGLLLSYTWTKKQFPSEYLPNRTKCHDVLESLSQRTGTVLQRWFPPINDICSTAWQLPMQVAKVTSASITDTPPRQVGLGEQAVRGT